MQTDRQLNEEKNLGADAPSNSFDTRPAVGDDAPSRPIAIFLISDFKMLLQAMTQALQSQPQRYVLQGCATTDSGPEPWGEQVPDVTLLDLDMDPDHAMRCLRVWRTRGRHRVLLLSCHDNPSLVDQAIREGGNGLIGRHCAPEHFLRALVKVYQGEVWLDSVTTARLISGLAHRDRGDQENKIEGTLGLLTDKEQRILRDLLQNGGDPAKLIASRLFISESTLRNHLTSIYEKMGVHNRNGLIFHAVQSGMADRLAPTLLTRTPPGKPPAE